MITYAEKKRTRYWLITSELMTQYKDGSHSEKDSDGTLRWIQNDKLHRDDDKPAIITKAGTLEWWKNDLRHRDGDLPAYIQWDGSLEWWQNGDWHRICGPARIWTDGEIDWWINGKNITPEVRKWLNKKRWTGTPEQIFEFQLRFA